MKGVATYALTAVTQSVDRKEHIMIPINSAIGVLVFLVGLALVAAVAVNLRTQHLLKQCKDMLEFMFFMDEEMLLHRIERRAIENYKQEQEGYKHEGTE